MTIGEVFKGNHSLVLEAVLHCSDTSCQQEFPVIDGIPIIVPDVRLLLSTQTQQITNRSDLHHATLGMIGDASGDASEYNTRRQHLSIYGWDAYAEFDPAYGEPDAQPGALARCLDTGLELLGGFEGPALDLGCAVGRSTFELGQRTGQLVLGIDLSFAMLQLAQQVLQTGQASFPRRETGVVYETMDITTPFNDAGNVDFWLCDAMALPLAPGCVKFASALNLLDCVPSPLALLKNIETVLADDGTALIGCPYDWSSGASAMEHWIGGHSPRSDFQGSSERLLEALLTPGAHPQSLNQLSLAHSPADVPWQTRLHARSVNHYRTQLLALKKNPADPAIS